MFFIGATGQLLTLILTVCLPFVFLLSGKQSINIANSSLQIEGMQVQQEIAYTEHINSISFYDDNNVEKCYFNLISENSSYLKFPLREFNVKKDLLYIDSSGNKAPPIFLSFC